MNRTPQANKNVSMLAGVIVMAVFAVGLGYLLGSWMIQFVTGQTPTAADPIGSEITITDPGPSQVTLPSVDVPETNYSPNTQQQQQSGLYVVQLGAFNSQANANRLANELMNKGYTSVQVTTGGPPFKVQIGAGTTRSEAEQMRARVKQDGYVDVFIVH